MYILFFCLTSLLEDLLRLHHELYSELHPQCMKPKLHLNRHLPKAMERHRLSLSCLPPERKHKDAKQKATHLFKDFKRGLLTNEAMTMIHKMGKEALFHKTRLGNLSPTKDDMIVALAIGNHNVQLPIVVSISAQNGILHFHREDLLFWLDGTFECVGRAHLFIRDCMKNHFAIVLQFRQSGQFWDTQGAIPSCVALEEIKTALPYVMIDEHCAYVLKPACE